MSSSREGSPDWLRSFQAPTTTSLLSLSSSSKSSPNNSPYRESETISSLPEPDDIEATTIFDKESSEPLSRKNSKTKVVKKQVTIEHVFSRKKKADGLDLEGMKGGETKAQSKSTDERLKTRGKKAGKKVKDPNKPKRPPSAFFVFLEGFRKEFTIPGNQITISPPYGS